jgi:hypothetical protein
VEGGVVTVSVEALSRGLELSLKSEEGEGAGQERGEGSAGEREEGDWKLLLQ